jgi:hypothetical protein
MLPSLCPVGESVCNSPHFPTSASIFDCRIAHGKDKTVNISESKVFPDMLQILVKVTVGGTIPLVANNQSAPRQNMQDYRVVGWKGG